MHIHQQKSSCNGWIQLVPPVSHLLLPGCWFCYCSKWKTEYTWGKIQNTGRDFSSGNLAAVQETKTGLAELWVRTQTACKYRFNKMICKKCHFVLWCMFISLLWTGRQQLLSHSISTYKGGGRPRLIYTDSMAGYHFVFVIWVNWSFK